MLHYQRIIERKLNTLFPLASDRLSATAMLLQYGNSASENEPERVRLAILKLAGSDLLELKRMVEGAKEDYRDIIAWAEYPRQIRMQIGNRKLNDIEKMKIEKEDLSEYDSWTRN